MHSKALRISRWSSLHDLYRIVRGRVAAKKGNYEHAVQLLDADPGPRSLYYRFIPLYRLTLMVLTKDPRRTTQAKELLANEWPVESDDDRWFETYRQFLCFAILSVRELSESARLELRMIPVPKMVSGTIGVPA
jgi:hypothetical protein